MRRLVAVGACYIDTILTVDRFPAEDEKLRASNVTHRRGGNCPNTLDVLRQLLQTEQRPSPVPVLLAPLPAASSPSVKLLKDAFGPSVDLSRCFHREGYTEPPSGYVIKSTSAATRTIVNYNVLPEMTTDEFIAMMDWLNPNECWFHFEGRIPEVTLECLRHLRQNYSSAKISVEVEKPGRPGLQALAALADAVFYSKSWAQGHGYQSPDECLKSQASLTPKAEVLCCTWGHDGASALELPSRKCTHSPAFLIRDRKVIDTIGAGDTFIAGMLYGFIVHPDEWVMARRLAFANQLAGRKVAQEGFAGLGELMQQALVDGEFLYTNGD